MEGSRRFRTLPPTPLRPCPCGASHLGSPARPGGGRRTKEGESSSKWNYQFLFWQVSGGKVWEALEGLGVQVGLPNLLGLRPKGLLATYIMRGGGGGATHKSPAPPGSP